MARQVKSIVKRNGLLDLAKVAEMFCYKKETLLKKWHSGEPVIRELELRKAGKNIVVDERNVWKVLEKYKNSLEVVIPRYKSEKSTAKGEDINLTVYINTINEKDVSPEHKEAILRVREIYAQWIEEADLKLVQDCKPTGRMKGKVKG
jgi:hypothetical protein